MTGKRDTARRALERSVGFLAPEHHDQILAALSSEGLLDEPKNAENGGKIRAAATDLPKRPLLTPLQASQARNGANKDLLRSVMAQAARMGYQIKDNELVDMVALNAALKGQEVGARLALKAALHKLALIP
jgi:Tfp pilus assembly ATPase PilU